MAATKTELRNLAAIQLAYWRICHSHSERWVTSKAVLMAYPELRDIECSLTHGVYTSLAKLNELAMPLMIRRAEAFGLCIGGSITAPIFGDAGAVHATITGKLEGFHLGNPRLPTKGDYYMEVSDFAIKLGSNTYTTLEDLKKLPVYAAFRACGSDRLGPLAQASVDSVVVSMSDLKEVI